MLWEVDVVTVIYVVAGAHFGGFYCLSWVVFWEFLEEFGYQFFGGCY